MLELLLYCHMFAKLRYAAEIAAAADAVIGMIGRVKARYERLLAPAAPAGKAPAFPFGAWTEREMASALDRLDAFVVSAA